MLTVLLLSLLHASSWVQSRTEELISKLEESADRTVIWSKILRQSRGLERYSQQLTQITNKVVNFILSEKLPDLVRNTQICVHKVQRGF